MEKKRNMALGFLFGAAVLIAFGVLYRDWWSGQIFHNGEVSIGVRSVQFCVEGECETQPLSVLAGTEHGGWATTGSILFFVGLATSLILAVAGGLFLAGKDPKLPMAPTTASFLLSAAVVILTFVFVMLKPKELHGTGMQGGLSLFPTAGGAILGVLGSVMLAKLRADQDRVAWQASLGGPEAG